MNRKKITAVLIALTTVNLLIFFFRDHFQFQPYVTTASLYGSCDEDCARKWGLYTSSYGEAERLRTAKIVASLPVTDGTVRARVQAIGEHLYNQFGHRLGTPPSGLLDASPLTQYNTLRNQDSLQLHCGNYSLMFAYFCWSQGIVCRTMELPVAGNHHVLNECYLPESGEWMVVDLTYNLLSAQDSNGKLLNFPTLRELARKRGTVWAQGEGATGRRKIAWQTFGATNYYVPELPVYYYHPATMDIYSTSYKLRRYFLPQSWYDILDRNTKSNVPFYLKLTVFALWLLTFFIFIARRMKFKL